MRLRSVEFMELLYAKSRMKSHPYIFVGVRAGLVLFLTLLFLLTINLPTKVFAEEAIISEEVVSDTLVSPDNNNGNESSASQKQPDSNTSSEVQADTDLLVSESEPEAMAAMSAPGQGGSGSGDATAGESSTVDSTSGSFQTTYPIVVPPGRNGMQPNLILQYDGGANSQTSIFGYGWDINIPYISRINKTGTENLYATTSSTFYSSLSGELVPSGVANEYRAKVESGSFLKYVFSNNTWTVSDKSGRTYTFGSASSSRQDNPSNSNQIYRWYLAEELDTNNNAVTYTYFKDAGQIYPDIIYYTKNGLDNGVFSVQFERESRADVVTSYQSRFAVKSNYRIKKITAFVDGIEVRSYELSYVSGDNQSRSMLSEILEAGIEGSNTKTRFPQTFDYKSTTAEGWVSTSTWATPEPFSIDGLDTGLRVVDINGDSYPDLVRYYGTHTGQEFKSLYLSNGLNSWVATTTWNWSDVKLWFAIAGETQNSRADYGTRFTDVNGDGLTDAVTGFDNLDGSSSDHKTVFINTGTGWASSTVWKSPVYFTKKINESTTIDTGVRIGDINGDRLPDFVHSYINTLNNLDQVVQINNGQNGWVESYEWGVPEPFTNCVDCVNAGQDLGTHLVDVNGDGLDDIVRAISTSSTPVNRVYLNTGSGWVLDNTIQLPTLFVTPGDTGLRWLEANGDGLIDLAQSTSTVQALYLNNGAGWTASGQLPPTQAPFISTSGDTGVRAVDIDGDGLSDLIGNTGSTTYLNNRGFGDSLVETTLPEGGKVLVSHLASAEYRNGSQLLNPKVPYTFPTVSKIQYDPTNSASWEDSYIYEDGSYHFASTSFRDRTFAGFGKITKTSPLSKTVSYYHQNNDTNTGNGETTDSYAKIGLEYKTLTNDLAGNNQVTNVTKWSETALSGGATFINQQSQTLLNYDGDSDHRDTAVSYTYDTNNGNLLQKIEYGEVTAATDGSFTDTGTDKLTTVFTYGASSTNPLLTLPIQASTTDQQNVLLKLTKYYYDNAAFGTVTKGNLTKQDDWATSTTYSTNQWQYNSRGLVGTSTDPRGNISSVRYDSYNLYPAVSKNALGHLVTSTYDYSSGKPKAVVDINGFSHELIYDPLDRLLEVKEPRGTNGALVTVEKNTYTDTPGNVSVQNRKYLDSVLSVDNYTYFDGFGRKIQTRQEAENANQFAVADTIYDQNGQVGKESLPYFSNGSGRTNATNQSSLYTNYAYDALGRKSAVGTVLGTTTYAYDQWQETVTDALGNQKKFQYDAYGQLVNVQEQNSTSTYTTTYAWTPHSQLEKITDALGNIRNFSYDGLGRRTRAEDLHATGDTTFGVWQYVYDAAGNLGTTTDPKNQITVVSYDALNRPVSENFTGQAGIEATYVYDTCTNGKGYLCTSVSPAASTTRQYNPAGLVASELKAIGTSTFTHSYLYNRQNNQTELTYPDNSNVRYTYNTAGQLEKVEQKEASGSYRDIISNFNYGPHGLVTYQLHGNGASTTKTYDQNALYRLKNILTTATNPIGGGGEELRMLELGNLSEGEIQQILSGDLTTSIEETTPALPDGVIAEPMPLLAEDVVVEDIKATSSAIATSTVPAEAVIEPVVDALPIEVKEAPVFKDTDFTPKRGSFEKPTEDIISYQFTSESKGSEKVEVELNKFMPEVRFKKWDGAVDFGLSYLDVSGVATYSTEKNIVQWQDQKSTKMVEAYPLKPTIGMEDGGFEIEVVLMEKPESNVFPFYIDGYEGLDFFYQPALDQEKQDNPNIASCTATECVDKEGNLLLERAENIVGSYAVYAKDSNSSTGKVGHIYRPKVVDASGTEVWAEMTYNDGLLEVVVPDEFLAKATYPVRVDPTFGYGVVGGSTVLGIAAGEVFGGTIQATTPATVDSISVYVEGANTAMKGIVTDGSLNLLANGVSPAKPVASTTYTWQTMTFASGSKPVLSAAGTYYLGTIVASSSPWLRYRFDTIAGDSRIHDNTNSFTTPTSPTDAFITTPRRASIFASYTVTNPTIPLAPLSLLAESAVNPTSVTDSTPEFSAIFSDTTSTDIATSYQIQVSTTSDFSSFYWDSGKETLSSSTPVGQRSPDISYSGATLQSHTDYYWRIRFFDNTETAGDWSTSTAYFKLGAVVSGAGYNIYTDSVASGWTFIPQNASTSFSTSTVYSGSNAIKVDFNPSTYTDVNFTSATPFNQNYYQYLDLYYKTDDPNGQYVWVYFVDYPNYNAYGCCHIGDYVVGGFATGTWNHVQIPLSAFGTTTVPLKELVFTTYEDVVIHLDDIRLTGTTTTTLPSSFVPVLQNITYTYDTLGNITQIVDSSGTRGAATTTYTYDSLYRLTSASTTGTTIAPFKETYTYNAIGNLVSKTGSGNYTYAGNTGSNYANPHAATSINGVTYNYDRNGNLASTSASQTNVWDYRNRLATTTKNGVSSIYQYDTNEQRVQKKVGTTITRYPSQYYETVGASTTKHIYANGALVSSIDGVGSTSSRVYHNHLDHLSSTNVVSTDIGYLDHLYSYLPYGATRLDEGTFNQTNQFIGQNRDAEADLNYLNARYYQSTQGQFVSQDPMFWSNNLNLQNPQSLNSYSYAEGNPVTLKDPLGLAATKAEQMKVLKSQLKILTGIQSLYNSGNKKDAERAFKAYTTAFGKGGVNTAQKGNIAPVYGPVQPTQGPIQRQDITKSLNLTMKEHSEDRKVNWPWYFKEKVRNGGSWDLKNTAEFNAKVNHQGFVYQDKILSSDAPGNLHYGYVGASAIWSSHDFLLEKAGQAQIDAGTSEPQWQNQYFHGDDPVDQINIVWGISQYYDR